jgi:hypothetical protein
VVSPEVEHVPGELLDVVVVVGRTGARGQVGRELMLQAGDASRRPIDKKYRVASDGSLVKLECENSEDDDYSSSQSARRGAETYDFGEDEDDGDEVAKAKFLQEEHDREVAEALDAKFVQEQHDREVGEAVEAEMRDDYGEANTENFD